MKERFENIISLLPPPYYKDDWCAIYHGDCREILPLLPDKSIDLVLTDPPYGINFVPQRTYSKKRFHDIPIANDELNGDKWLEWFHPINGLLYNCLKDDSVAYYFSGFNPYYYYYSMLKAGYEIKANLIWVKEVFGMGYHFRRQYEQILVGFKGAPPVPKQALSDVIFSNRVSSNTILHSCQKPTILIERLVNQYPSDIILDPFLGSGTTTYCAKKLNRYSIGIEIEEKYCEVAAKRCSQQVMELSC